MSVCIFYDSDEVTDDDVRLALQEADPSPDAHVSHVAVDDVRWFAEIEPQLIGSVRSEAFRSDLARLMDELAGMVAADPRWRQALTYRGIDVLDVARFSWFFRAEVPAHRAWVVAQILESLAPD
ncbi:MAG TPA: hypothetical protein VEI97_02290, partial [bacterium]|nr:hypothetical protein [bacterium]